MVDEINRFLKFTKNSQIIVLVTRCQYSEHPFLICPAIQISSFFQVPCLQVHAIEVDISFMLKINFIFKITCFVFIVNIY